MEEAAATCVLVLEGIATAAVLYVIKSILTPDPPVHLGVYHQPGRWYGLKFALMYLLVKLQQGRKKQKREKDAPLVTGLPQSGYGVLSHDSPEEMDLPQELQDHEHALDSAYFNGFAPDGTAVVMRICRRHGRRVEIWFILHVPGVGVLQAPQHPDTAVFNTDGKTFSAAGLSFEPVEAMRKWKVQFNGMMRLTESPRTDVTKEEGSLVHVKFSFMWSAYTLPFNFDTDIHPRAIARAMAIEKWNKQFFQDLRSSHQTHYNQWGQLWGGLHIEGHEEQHVRLKGYRDHSFGVRDWGFMYRYIVHFAYLEDGTCLQVATVCFPTTMSDLRTGYVFTPNGKMEAVSAVDLVLSSIGEDGTMPHNYSFNFVAGGKKYHVQVEIYCQSTWYNGLQWESRVHERLANFTVNGLSGWGVCEFNYKNTTGCPLPPRESRPQQPLPDVTSSHRKLLTLPLSSPVCRSTELVGGKGSSLATLTALQSNGAMFKVPSGFCVTMAAMKLQLKLHPTLKSKLEELAQVSCSGQVDALKGMCQGVGEMFISVALVPEVREAIKAELDNLSSTSQFAVRSSAIGEDTEEMSAAGQMITDLGVRGLDQICDSVQKCWTSLYGFPAVQYRRQHGQPVVSSMAVVVQEMVPAEVAGVLFTQHPVTGHPGKMVINANYGLGESVVSGESHPDTITLSRGVDGSCQVEGVDLGSKTQQVVPLDNGGTALQEVNSAQSEKCCLSNDTAVCLGHIAVQVEEAYGGPQDIEWAVSQDTVYLLQARPITTFGIETEWELMHEFDAPLSSEKEISTTSNIAEMMPGAVTPLTASTFSRAIEYGLQNIAASVGLKNCQPYFKKMGLCLGHMFINMHNVAEIYEQHVTIADKRVAEMSLVGRCLEEITMDDIIEYHGKSSLWKGVVHSFNFVKHLYTSKHKIHQLEQTLTTYSICRHDNATAMYQEINERLPEYYQAWADHMSYGARSAAWSTVLMMVLSQGAREWTMQLFSDMAHLYVNCEQVTSADVPDALEKLAVKLIEEGHRDRLIAMSPQEATAWLLGADSGPSGQLFQTFLDLHGHRCLREAELREMSWRAAPTKVVLTIQTMLKNNQIASVKEPFNFHEAVKKIKSPITFAGRYILKWTLPYARQGVMEREQSKSAAVKMADHFKQAYWYLALLMVAEGRLPEEDLLFFLTHQEIGTLLRSRSAVLVAKALRRRRILPKQMSLKFPEICRGHPVPIEVGVLSVSESDLMLKGMPVSHGTVTAPARVVTRLEDAGTIQAGEILIVQSTDIGWSPYFPLLSGLVTELGGLISHGAVVAREYGLPCVVSVKNATAMFQTGDLVLLNGTEGSVRKLNANS
ncbi:rifampicin phosphotransferase-like isoform X1 [Branchiostoma lanceolatum]|uniref:rifampicin phosphotransferase-like isoform X1 n=1 Tax=Branchiostoma lanceolatum TaxID=7740 RepID=UPI0034541D62